MEPNESLPIMHLTRRTKINIGFASAILGFIAYKGTVHIMNGVLESVAILLYEDLDIVLVKK